MTNPFIKNATLPRNSRMEWIALDHGRGPMIAKVTLAEVATALAAAPESLVSAAQAAPWPEPLAASLPGLPELAEIGSVARLVATSGHAVAIARIGAESFVAFARLEPEGAPVALTVTFDPATERLTVGDGTGAH
jgi:hypothetical protein